MLKKIISGGQTGADRAALDVAIKLNMKYGGWIPKGRKTEAGPLPDKYSMSEMQTADYRERTLWNVRDSDGTLLFSYGTPTGGTKLTLTDAKVLGKPNCPIDLISNEAFEAAMMATAFIRENNIETLNVAGPRLSHFPGIYTDVKIILESMLYMLFLDTGQDLEIRRDLKFPEAAAGFPESVSQAVSSLAGALPLKTRTVIARCSREKVADLYFVLLDNLRQMVGFDGENPLLLKNCRALLDDEDATVEDGIMVILKHLKQHLETDHLLKVVK